MTEIKFVDIITIVTNWTTFDSNKLVVQDVCIWSFERTHWDILLVFPL